MFNFTELAYVLNGTPIAFLNTKNNQYLSLDMSNYSFKVNGTHPYLINKEFEKDIKTVTKFNLVLSSMPNYEANSPRSIITYGTQISFMAPDQMFLVATNNGELKLEKLKGDMSLSSMNLPINSKFTVIDPYNQANFSKPLLYNDEIVLRSTFGGYLSLSSNSELSSTNPDALYAVNSNGMIIIEDSIWKLIKTNVPYIPDWVHKRKYLNFNLNSYLYNLDQSLNNTGTKSKNTTMATTSSTMKKMTKNINKDKPSLMTLSTSMQDKCLVEDILLTMLGMEGNYIKRITSHTSFKDFKIEFQIEPYLDNPTCDPPLLSLGNLLLPLSFYYDSITNYLNINTNVETGLVSKAFCFGLKKLIREYVLFVNQLDCQMRSGNNLNLQQLWWLCQPCLKLLENLHKLCQKCSMIKGGALINIIYSAYLHETDSQMKKMYKFLLDKSFVPYFEMLKQWVCRGFLENDHEFQEFMIVSPKDYSKEKLKENYLDLFWEMKFKLNSINVPEFLTRISEKILFIGKSLNIIRESGKIIQCPFEAEFDSFATNKNSNANNTNVTEDNTNADNGMIFENERLIQFEKLIEKIYTWTNETLKAILFKEKSLDSLIKSFKKFYLMESGDFYTYLIDLVGEMFFAQKKEINFEKIQKHIDNAMRMTSANLDSNKDQFYFTLSNMSISMQKEHLDQYIKILDSNENDIEVITNQLKVLYNSKASINLDDMKLYECIVLESKISWPLNLIFSKKNIIKYQILFRQLMYLKLVAKELSEAWITQQNFKTFSNQGYLRKSYFLRDNMLNFIKNIIYYFFNEIIEPNYIKLMNNLQISSSMEEVMKYHDEFLDICLRDCLLANNSLLGEMNNVVMCCSIFSRLLGKFYGNAILAQKDVLQKRIGIRYKGMSVLERKKMILEEQSQAVKKALFEGEVKFDGYIEKFSKSFDTRFQTFLKEVEKLNKNAKTYNSHVNNLLTKLDYNNYYYDKFARQAE